MKENHKMQVSFFPFYSNTPMIFKNALTVTLSATQEVCNVTLFLWRIAPQDVCNVITKNS